MQGGPASKQLGGKLAGQWLVECQAPLVGEADGHCGCHARGDARRALRCTSLVYNEAIDAAAVQCGGDASIEILELQPEGKKRMAARDFIHGYKPKSGERLGE